MDPFRFTKNPVRPGIQRDPGARLALRILAHQPAWPGLRKEILERELFTTEARGHGG